MLKKEKMKSVEINCCVSFASIRMRMFCSVLFSSCACAILSANLYSMWFGFPRLMSVGFWPYFTIRTTSEVISEHKILRVACPHANPTSVVCFPCFQAQTISALCMWPIFGKHMHNNYALCVMHAHRHADEAYINSIQPGHDSTCTSHHYCSISTVHIRHGHSYKYCLLMFWPVISLK